MNIVRSVTMDDLGALVALAKLRKVGLTSLPKDEKLLRKKILRSLRGFDMMDDEDPHGQSYLFVLEEEDTHRMIGTSGIESKVGGFEPFYTYSIEKSIHESTSLGVVKEIPTLHLIADHNGPCEIGTLFLHPDYRGSGNGRLLSLSRFLFMAQHRQFFDPLVIAEVRGVIGANGHSPFWNAVGHHFFDLDFSTADELSAIDKKFIADLMPKHPIYIPLLAKGAQAVIGQPNEKSVPALKLLEAEGFCFCDMVDIFEAGPVVRCPRDEIRIIRESRLATIRSITVGANESAPFILATISEEFRACISSVEPADNGDIGIPGEVASGLKVKVGDTVRLSPLRPTVPTPEKS